MRKIHANLFMSLDGVVDSPQDWHFPYLDDEMMGAIGAGMQDYDAILLGRRTYEEWAASWPESDSPMAAWFNQTPKYVVSTTLAGADWQNSTLIDGDPIAAVRALKEQPGGTIMMSGSGTLVGTLLEAGLIDELRVMVHPIVVGTGKRLFADGRAPRGFRLADSATFRSGVLNLTYEPATAAAA